MPRPRRPVPPELIALVVELLAERTIASVAAELGPWRVRRVLEARRAAGVRLRGRWLAAARAAAAAETRRRGFFRGVRCPTCCAAPGDYCVTTRAHADGAAPGRRVHGIHPARARVALAQR